MSDTYSVLGGAEGMPWPDGWYVDETGTRWALYGVYVTSEGRMAPSGLISRYTIGVVFREPAVLGPRQLRRFARFSPRTRWWLEEPAAWFARSVSFIHPRDLLAAAAAAGQPFRRAKVFWGAGVAPSPTPR